MLVADLPITMESLIFLLADRLFSLFCHQQPVLLMHVEGSMLPVCYRCGFVYLGVFLAFSVSTVCRKKMPSWSIGLLFISIMFSEWFISNVDLFQGSALSRSISGFVGGVGGVIVLSDYGFKIIQKQMGVPMLVLSILVILFSFQTAILTLILLAFALFWTGAIHAVYRIVMSLKAKGISYEVCRQG